MSLTAFNGKLLFNGCNGVTATNCGSATGPRPAPSGEGYFSWAARVDLSRQQEVTQVMIALSHSAALAASDGFTGLELSKTNGTGVGTMLVQDIFAGPASSTPQFVRPGRQPGLLPRRQSRAWDRLWAAPLAALDVSLEEQIDELLGVTDRTVSENVRLPASLNALLTGARGEVGNEQIAGQFVAARVHLSNFIKAVQGLVARGSLTTSQAQPLLDGATAILEQIEGNHPKKTLADQGDPGISMASNWKGRIHLLAGAPVLCPVVRNRAVAGPFRPPSLGCLDFSLHARHGLPKRLKCRTRFQEKARFPKADYSQSDPQDSRRTGRRRTT